MELEQLEFEVARFDELLKPIANRPVSVEELAKLDTREHPLDTAGIRTEAWALVRKILNAYAAEDAKWRAAVRELFERYQAFAWAADPGVERSTQDGLRIDLLMFSIQDQGRDPRDARLWLNALHEEAQVLHSEWTAVLKEVAAYSSTIDRYGWGSTQSWLLALCEDDTD